MRLPVFLGAGIVLSFFLSLGSCDKQPAYTAEVQQLDSLLTAVQTAKLSFDTLDKELVTSQLDQIKKDMKLLQSLEGITLTKEEADFFNAYNNTKRLIKDFPEQHRRIEKELERTTLQLTQLKEALQNGATVDGSGNEISDDYVRKQMGIEKDVASHLIEEIYDMRTRIRNADTRFQKQNPQATTYLEQWTDLSDT